MSDGENTEKPQQSKDNFFDQISEHRLDTILNNPKDNLEIAKNFASNAPFTLNGDPNEGVEIDSEEFMTMLIRSPKLMAVLILGGVAGHVSRVREEKGEDFNKNRTMRIIDFNSKQTFQNISRLGENIVIADAIGNLLIQLIGSSSFASFDLLVETFSGNDNQSKIIPFTYKEDLIQSIAKLVEKLKGN